MAIKFKSISIKNNIKVKIYLLLINPEKYYEEEIS
jgi:hypothetical protein